MATVENILNVTRDDAAMRGFTHAVERIRKLERETDACFEQYERAVEQCHDNGLEVMAKFTKPVDAGYAAYKNQGYADRS